MISSPSSPRAKNAVLRKPRRSWASSERLTRASEVEPGGLSRSAMGTKVTSEAPLREKAVLGAGETEVFAQGPAFVFAAEEVAALQFGDDAVDEIVEAARDPREHDVEAVAGVAVEPLLHLVGDHRWRADQREAAVAAGDLRQLAHRQIVAPGALDDALAAALAGVALGDLGQRAVEVEDRGVAAQGNRQRGDAAVGVHEDVEQGPLVARLLRGIADDDEAAGQDLDVVRVAPDPPRPLPDIGVVALGVGELAAAGEDHLGSLGGELAAGVGGA